MDAAAPWPMMRIPTEFRYWENRDKPWAQKRARLVRILFRCDPWLPDATVRTWASTYYDADPVAEAFIDEVYMTQGQQAGRAMLDTALEQGVNSVANAPESLLRLFDEVERDPDWVDRRLVERGAKVFRNWRSHLYSNAGAITLHGYRENSVAKPLVFTGAYAGKNTNSRFLETAQFWHDVSQPGGLDRGGIGIRTALRVRMMHVFVRRRLLDHPDWDLDAWGVPISQGDALLTLMGGSFIPGYMLRLLGHINTRDDILATMHFWRYVGHVMGVQPRWYPESIEDAARLMLASEIKSINGSGDDGKWLVQSYVKSYAPKGEEPLPERARKWFEYLLQRGYVGLFIPPATQRQFELPPAGLTPLLPLAQTPFVLARESMRRVVPLLDRWLDRQSVRANERWLRQRLGERKAQYTAVETFTR
ncbi:MAG: DUF2236 domain-containing protein [Candidatus Dadabacteria bacterium]|nr:MAG: DUF2236 domain-containing protein [Candidatus Dadabacteria bacterium]